MKIFESSVMSRDINTGREVIKKTLSDNHARKSCEALIKVTHGATSDFIVEKVNKTNEALHQQFNRYFFKLEQFEYEKEGILWKYITFPDNQDVIDLIDKKYVDILVILDDQCIKQSQKMSIDSLDDVLDTISLPTNSSLDSLDSRRG